MLLILLMLLGTLMAQLQSGPMVGYCEMREAVLWVQTSQPARVQFRYRVAETDHWMMTAEVTTRPEQAHVAHSLASPLLPGTRYQAQLLLNGKPHALPYPLTFSTPADWRTARQNNGNPPDLRIALGSCTYISDSLYDKVGEPYGGNYEIFESIRQKNPDLMVWLGDNTYMRPADEYGWTSICYRNTHTRSLPQLQPLLAACPHYAITDDHDLGPNNVDRSFRDIDKTRAAFELFWPNPDCGSSPQPSLTTTFERSDVQFFLMDNRSFRAPNTRLTGDRSHWGEEQLQWLIDNLKSSRATFKLVCTGGQVLNPEQRDETMANYHAEERARLLDLLRAERIPGVIFLDGDRHFSELSMLKMEQFYPLYDFTVSPLTSKGFTAFADHIHNPYRVEGSGQGVRNFGLLEVTGPKENRQLRLALHDSAGKLLFEKIILATELKP